MPGTVCFAMGLIGLIMACYGGLYGILTGLSKSTDHRSIPGNPTAYNHGLLSIDFGLLLRSSGL